MGSTTRATFCWTRPSCGTRAFWSLLVSGGCNMMNDKALYEWREGAVRPIPEDYVAPTKKPPYVVFENQFMCTRCGAGVISRKIHTKWHKSLKGKIQVA